MRKFIKPNIFKLAMTLSIQLIHFGFLIIQLKLSGRFNFNSLLYFPGWIYLGFLNIFAVVEHDAFTCRFNNCEVYVLVITFFISAAIYYLVSCIVHYGLKRWNKL